VDGSKRSESYHNLGLEAWVDTEVPLSEGSHKASVVLANYDNRIIKKSFTFSVGASSCAQSSSPTATVICSPANGSAVSSPVSVEARGGSSVTWMEVWLDGTKRYQGATNTVSISLDTLAAGSHRLSVYGKSGGTVLSKATADFVVK
jgi:hypothetical protein